MLHKNRINIKGFSFAETVVAVLILMLGVLFLVTLFPLSIKNLGKSKQITIATNLAQQKLEEYINNPASITSARGGFSDYPGFYYQINKKRVTWGTDLKQVTVRVFHTYNDAPVVDATLSRIILEKSGKYEIYSVIADSIEVTPDSGEILIATLTVPVVAESGTYLINIYGNMRAGRISDESGRGETIMTSKIYAGSPPILRYEYDTSINIPSGAGPTGAVKENQKIFTSIHLPQGVHTFKWTLKASKAKVTPQVGECKMTVIFIPDSLGLYTEPIYVEPEE